MADNYDKCIPSIISPSFYPLGNVSFSSSDICRGNFRKYETKHEACTCALVVILPVVSTANCSSDQWHVQKQRLQRLFKQRQLRNAGNTKVTVQEGIQIEKYGTKIMTKWIPAIKYNI